MRHNGGLEAPEDGLDAATGDPLALTPEPEPELATLPVWALARRLARREQDALDLAIADAIDAALNV